MQTRLPIIPHYKLMVKFDIRPEDYERYMHYVLKEFIPGLERMALYPLMAWHTAYGDHPIRQLEFVSESLEIVNVALASEKWIKLEETLKCYTFNYHRKVIPFRDRFQF